jgi:iron complex outermembrane receptor protein
MGGKVINHNNKEKIMKRIFYLFLLLAIGIIKPQSSVDNKNTDTLKYIIPQDIIVTAPRLNISLRDISFSTSIVQQDFLKSLAKYISIDEPLKIVPGVKVDNQANGNRIHLSIRGIGILSERGIRGIKLLQDEIPINDPTGFAPDLFDIDFVNVDRIEVLRGPAASLYGGSASGGIVNIITKNAPAVPLFGDAGGTFGSNNFWKAYGQFGGNVDDLNYRLLYSRTMGDGYRDHTHFWGNTFYGKMTYTPNSNIKLTPIVGYTNFYHENPEGINLEQYQNDPKQANPDAIPYNEFLQTERNTFALNGLLISGNHELQFNGYTKRTRFTEANNHTFNYRTIITPGTSLQYSFKYGLPDDFFKNKIGAGIDMQWQKINESRVANNYSLPGTASLSNEEIKQDGLGLFLFDNMNLGTQWDLMFSLRYDKINNKLTDILKDPYDASGEANFSKITGRVGITYSLMKEANIFVNWGQGFLPPATEELAQNPDNFGGFNTHLTYSSSNGFDLGCRGYVKDNVFYDITGFYLKTENDFDRYRITDSLRNQETFYRNAGSSDRLGIEFYTKYSPINFINLQVAYTYSHFKYTNTEPVQIVMDDPSVLKYIENGNFLPNSPQHQLYFDAEYTYNNDFYIAVSLETQSQTYIDGANIEAEAADGFTLFHARVGYYLHLANYDLEFSLYAKNLADQKYIACTEPDPGGNAYQPGSGREFFGSLKIHL